MDAQRTSFCPFLSLSLPLSSSFFLPPSLFFFFFPVAPITVIVSLPLSPACTVTHPMPETAWRVALFRSSQDLFFCRAPICAVNTVLRASSRIETYASSRSKMRKQDDGGDGRNLRIASPPNADNIEAEEIGSRRNQPLVSRCHLC